MKSNETSTTCDVLPFLPGFMTQTTSDEMKNNETSATNNVLTPLAGITTQTESNPPKLSYMERFLALQQRRIDMTKGSTERRMNEMKTTLLKNVEQNMQQPDELMEILKACNLQVELRRLEQVAAERKRKRPHSKNIATKSPRTALHCGDDTICTVQSTSVDPKPSNRVFDVPSSGSSDISTGRVISVERTADDAALPICFGPQPEKRQCPNTPDKPKAVAEKNTWAKVRPFLTVNDHLITTTGSGRPCITSHLEEKLETAIQARDLEKAEELSDQLSNREFGTRIVGAIEAKKYADEREREKEAKAAASKKKLAWGFVQKHRWETKGNM